MFATCIAIGIFLFRQHNFASYTLKLVV